MLVSFMNRLEKKCLVASVGFHLLLVLTLLIGAAFRPPSPPPGNPSVVQLIRLEQQPEPPASAQAQSAGGSRSDLKPTVSSELNPNIAEPDALEPVVAPKPKLPQNSLTPRFRQPGGGSNPKQPATANSRVVMFDQALKALGQGVSPSTTITTDFGGGGSGEASEYAQFVKDAYTRGWNPSGSGVTSQEAVTKVTVTVGCDGRVLSARITQPSNDPQADRTVQKTLERITVIKPFEPSAKERQRTYTINFNLRASIAGH